MTSSSPALAAPNELTAQVAKYVYKHKICLRVGALKQEASAVNSAYGMAADITGWFAEKDKAERMKKQLQQLQFEAGVVEGNPWGTLREKWEALLDKTIDLIIGFDSAADQKILLLKGTDPGADDYKCFSKVHNLAKDSTIVAETTFGAVGGKQGLKAWIYAQLGHLAATD